MRQKSLKGKSRKLTFKRTYDSPSYFRKDAQSNQSVAGRKAEEIFTFAELIMKQHEEYQLTQGIQQMAAQSATFDFLNQEEDLYTEADLKEVYNGKK